MPPKRRTKWQRRLASPKIPWAAGALVLFILVIAVWLRSRAAGRPDYALRQIGKAIERADGTKLAYYADASALTTQVVNETVDWLAAKRGLEDAIGGAGASDGGSRASRLQDAKMTFGDRLGRAISAGVASPDPGGDDVSSRVIDAFISQPPLSAIVSGDHFDVRSVDRPLIDDQTATIPVTLRNRELVVDVKIGLVLQRAASRWRLVGISGLPEALNTINNAQFERIAIANRPLEGDLERLVTVGALDVRRVKRGRAPAVYRLSVPLTNESPGSIILITLGLGARGSDDHPTMLSVEHPIAAGTTSAETWEFDEGATRGTRLAYLLNHPERLTLRTRSIVLDTAGTADTVRLIGKYVELKDKD